jgi:hypothetical protein
VDDTYLGAADVTPSRGAKHHPIGSNLRSSVSRLLKEKLAAHSDAGQGKLLEAVGRTSGRRTLFSYVDLEARVLGDNSLWSTSEAADHACGESSLTRAPLGRASVPARHWPRALWLHPLASMRSTKLIGATV